MIRAVGRAWVLGAIRRPSRAAVVVVAIGVMTTATVAALVAADTLEALFVADASAEWGAVDVEVTSVSGAFFSESAARTVAFEAADVTESAAPRLILPAVASTGEASSPDAIVLGLGAEEQQFPELDVLAGRGDVQALLALQPDEAIVNERLARRLGLTVGDAVDVLVVVPEVRRADATAGRPAVSSPTTASLPLRVAGIVDAAGVADLHRRATVLVRRDVLQILTGTEGLVSHLHIAAPEDGRDGAQEVIRQFEMVMRQLGLTAAPVRADAMDVADDEGAQFRSILLTLALLGIGAAVVATVNLLTAMAEERSDEVALLRVMGVRGSGVRRMIMAEVGAYAPVGVALGILTGIPLGGVMATGIADRFADIGRERGREAVALAVSARPSALLAAGVVVVLAALWAGTAAGGHLATIPLDDLVRRTPPSRRPLPTGARRPLVALVLGASLAGMGLTADLAGDALLFLGTTLVLAAGWMWWRRQVASPGSADRPAAAIAIVWAVCGAAVLGDFSQGYETGFGILVVAGGTAIVAATVLTVHGLRPVVAPVLRRVRPRGLRAVLSIAVSHAADAPRRAASTQAVVAMVLFMVAALHVLGSATAIDPQRQGGGYDVVLTSAAPLDAEVLRSVPQLEDAVLLESGTVPETAFRVEDDDDHTYSVRYPVRLLPAGDGLIATQSFRLADALPGYETARDALQAVRADGRKAVVDRRARPDGARLGDDVVVDIGAGPRRYELIAVLDTFLLGGVVIPPEDVGGLVPSVGPTFALATARPQVASDDLASALTAAGREIGVDARSMAQEAQDLLAVNRTFTDVFSLMVVLGVLVAAAAEGALVLRAGRERRSQLAVLRAIGCTRGEVVMSLVAERVLMAILGAAIGVAVGIGVLRVLFAAGFSDLAFVVAWSRLAVLAGAVVGVMGVVTALAAVPAARHDTAVGLRDLG